MKYFNYRCRSIRERIRRLHTAIDRLRLLPKRNASMMQNVQVHMLDLAYILDHIEYLEEFQKDLLRVFQEHGLGRRS